MRNSALAIAWLLLASLASGPARSESLPLLVFVTTGGTIAESSDSNSGEVLPTVTGEALTDSVPGLKDIAQVRVEAVSNIDSRNMTPALWIKIANTVNQALSDPAVNGVVVIHGTDTMEETAFFLDVTAAGDKPVVVTGAMRPASSPFADGPYNLYTAAQQAIAPSSSGRNVTITFDGRIIAAAYATKGETSNAAAFDGGDAGLLGSVDDLGVRWYGRPTHGPHFTVPASLPDVPVIFDFPGNDGALLDAAVEKGVPGVVVAGFGIGDVSEGMFGAISRARARGVEVVLSTRVQNGRIYPAYGGPGGGTSMVDIGVILGADIGPWKNRILLMLALAQKDRPSDLQSLFYPYFAKSEESRAK